MTSEAQKRATAKYRKESVKAINLKFYPADMDLYAHLQSQSGKARYLKELIRADMEGRVSR